ncbi:MAG: choice-of-anchor J domain-containing protein [Muribaculaceae bacterium]|nr:choice-of-anchor J domain-containing protein [Muribaculaceae bacterium]
MGNSRFALSVILAGITLAGAAWAANDFAPAPKKHVKSTPEKIAPVVPSKTAMAWCTRDRGNTPLGLVEFDLSKPGTLTSKKAMPNLAYAGCYGDGKYYFDRYRTYTDTDGSQTWAHIAFSSVDPNTGTITDIKDWKDEYFVINDMTYDYTTGKIYAMIRNMYVDDFLTGFYFQYSAIATIAPTTGVLTEVKQFIDWGNGALTNPTYYTLACDLNGNLYSVNQNGELVTFDKSNDWAEVVIGRTGLNPSQTTQSMEFDHTTGALYYAADFKNEVAKLMVVDTASGLASPIGETGQDAHLVGLYIPFDLPSQAAPAQVTEYTVTPNAAGSENAVLTWTNPTKSFGGSNLATISKIDVIRNGEKVATLSGTPGQQMTYTDNVPAPGLYTYTVTCGNSAGAGLPSGVTRWVGKDVPMAVTELGIGRLDDGTALLEWKAPTAGAHAGVIDESSLGYKITRFPDGTVVASDCRECSFNDKSVSGMGRWWYTVESHTAQGVGETARTAEIALGAAIDKLPWSTLFADKSEFDLWTVVNNNGGSTWSWKSRTAGGYQAMAMYGYDNNNKGDDYLISPAIYLRAGGGYRVSFAYSGSNANYTEKMDVTFGNAATAEAQSQVIKSLSMKTGDFATCTVNLPEVTEDGYYHFAFHALSDPKQYNIYVTDVKVEMTVAPPSGPDDPVYEFITPHSLTANVDEAAGTLSLSWGHGDYDPTPGVTQPIVEDFESMQKWSLNPAGNYGWTYIDGDKGIPYKDDYYDMPYPTDGAPLAAMVLAPYDLHEYVYNVNPPHSGELCLLFKSNYSAGDGSRPAPAPDDWMISPRLSFNQDFIFSFWCKADPDDGGWGDLWNTEYYQVGYSLTDNNPESFIWMSETPEKVTSTDATWKKREYSIPAAAKYVCIHYCTPDCGYWFLVDDIYIGVPENTTVKAPLRASATPTLIGFDIFINDHRVGATTEHSYVADITSLTKGTHVAKVMARYAEGVSEPVATQFEIRGGSDVELTNSDVKVSYTGDAVIFSATVDSAALYDLTGLMVAQTNESNTMTLGNLHSGVYTLVYSINGKSNTLKIKI